MRNNYKVCSPWQIPYTCFLQLTVFLINICPWQTLIYMLISENIFLKHLKLLYELLYKRYNKTWRQASIFPILYITSTLILNKSERNSSISTFFFCKRKLCNNNRKKIIVIKRNEKQINPRMEGNQDSYTDSMVRLWNTVYG